MIAIVTDSNAQLPPEVAARYGIRIVPLTVTIDGAEYVEGVDLDADTFYGYFQPGNLAPVVSTSQPSPGRFQAAYESLVAEGADAIVSVHIGSALSGTVTSARLGAQAAAVPVPVRIVDTGNASFAVACSAWEAAEAIADGATAAEAAEVAEKVSRNIGNVFVVGALDLARAGGRLAADDNLDTPAAGAIPVLSLTGGAMHQVGHVDDLEAAAGAMASHVTAGGEHLRVGVGLADEATTPLRNALELKLGAAPQVSEVIRYRIGPSVGAHTGPGTVGAFFYDPSLVCPR